MIEIIRSKGSTPSERYLAKISEKTFLKLWAYPNLFIDKRSSPGASGKELCDLLVVFGDDVLIFSDKSVEWPADADDNLGWRRWYRRAVDKSVAQVLGAERWISNFPQRVFLNEKCQQPFPLKFPSAERRKVHGIVVAIGAHEACEKHFKGSTGTFLVAPDIQGKDHFESRDDALKPFAIGDVNPSGSFIHVFDDRALDLLMYELDTAADFIDYLRKREQFIRSKKLYLAPGEEELLGYYLQVEGAGNRRHDFTATDGTPFSDDERVYLTEGEYRNLVQRPEYLEKKKADRASYAWDRLIDTFGDHLLAGTAEAILGESPSVENAEQGLRIMAAEPRVERRLLAEALAGALKSAEQKGLDRYARVVWPGQFSRGREIAYVFLILAYHKHFDLEGGYEYYRSVRTTCLHGYCLNALERNRKLQYAVGIGLDASPRITGIHGSSEDMVAIHVPKWTPELLEEAKLYREKLDILRPKRLEFRNLSTYEFPSGAQHFSTEQLTRQQRRARERRDKKLIRTRNRKTEAY